VVCGVRPRLLRYERLRLARSRACQILLQTSEDATCYKKRGFAMSWMTWRVISGLADIAPNVRGCHLLQETRVCDELDDVAGNVWQALLRGGLLRQRRLARQPAPPQLELF
jgi:hypothetical protein